MKSSKIITKLNNRILITFPFLVMFGIASSLIIVCNLSFAISYGIVDYFNLLINGYIMPFYMALTIPAFILLLVYNLKLTDALERVEERS